MGKKASTPFSDHCQDMNGIILPYFYCILQRARKFLRIAKIGCIRVYSTSRELSLVRNSVLMRLAVDTLLIVVFSLLF
jgi:hypothetical protein